MLLGGVATWCWPGIAGAEIESLSACPEARRATGTPACPGWGTWGGGGVERWGVCGV